MTAAGIALRNIDALLRGIDAHAPGRAQIPWQHLLPMLVCAGFVYGAVMGGYGGRPLQSFYSGLKVPLFLAVSTAVCLPNFFVVNMVMGLRDDFPAAVRGILSAQAIVAICLAAFAPITAFAYASTLTYPGALVFNGVVFALASLGGQIALARHYRPLIARDPSHRYSLAAWLCLYWFVAIQLAWVLRPFVGAIGLPPTFFRDEAWGNAYVHVFEAIMRALGA